MFGGRVLTPFGLAVSVSREVHLAAYRPKCAGVSRPRGSKSGGGPSPAPPCLPSTVSCLLRALPRQHDLADKSHVPRPSSLAPHEIHSRRQTPHIIRARTQVTDHCAPTGRSRRPPAQPWGIRPGRSDGCCGCAEHGRRRCASGQDPNCDRSYPCAIMLRSGRCQQSSQTARVECRGNLRTAPPNLGVLGGYSVG